MKIPHYRKPNKFVQDSVLLILWSLSMPESTQDRKTNLLQKIEYCSSLLLIFLEGKGKWKIMSKE